LLYMRLGPLLKDDGRWQDALDQFDKAIAAAPTYAEAYREKGIAENKLYQKAGRPTGMPNGVDALNKAVVLNPDDYDAHASLAGALKRDGRLADALAEYERATAVSRGHSYPLLNALKLEAQLEGRLAIDDKRRFFLKRAERSLRAQVSSDPPYDPPWSFFDLAEIRLYDGDKNEFLSYASRGVEYATHAWQLNTFRESLESLPAAGINLPGLSEAISLLRERASYLQ
jgi:tetratricopeptide (TPR) repeat protein